MNHITVVKRGSDTAPGALRIYCGQGTPLGNPHARRGMTLTQRNRACDLFAATFPDEDQKRECDWLAKKAVAQPLEIECWCAPKKRCHLETVKHFLETEY